MLIAKKPSGEPNAGTLPVPINLFIAKMKKHVAKDMDQSLHNLKVILEKNEAMQILAGCRKMPLQLEQGQRKIKSGARAEFTFYPNFTMVTLNDLGTKVEPDTETGDILGLITFHPVITVEYLVDIRRLYAYSLVPHTDLHLLLDNLALYFNGFALRRIFNRVAE